MANWALLACVIEVLVWLDVPVVPPGVVCEVPVAVPVFWPAPLVVPAVTPTIRRSTVAGTGRVGSALADGLRGADSKGKRRPPKRYPTERAGQRLRR